MCTMGSRVSAAVGEDAIAYEVDVEPDALREAVREAGGALLVNTRQGSTFAVTDGTAIEPLEE